MDSIGQRTRQVPASEQFALWLYPVAPLSIGFWHWVFSTRRQILVSSLHPAAHLLITPLT